MDSPKKDKMLTIITFAIYFSVLLSLIILLGGLAYAVHEIFKIFIFLFDCFTNLFESFKNK